MEQLTAWRDLMSPASPSTSSHSQGRAVSLSRHHLSYVKTLREGPKHTWSLQPFPKQFLQRGAWGGGIAFKVSCGDLSGSMVAKRPGGRVFICSPKVPGSQAPHNDCLLAEAALRLVVTARCPHLKEEVALSSQRLRSLLLPSTKARCSSSYSRGESGRARSDPASTFDNPCIL